VKHAAALGVGLALAMFAGPARADESARSWEALYDARLVEATDGTPEVAGLYYEELVGELDPTNPLYGTAWYWLGRTRFVIGDTPAAVTALRTALRDPSSQAQASALLARIELRNRAITTLPVAFNFDKGTGAFVRAWEEAEKGQLEARTIQGRPVLAWGTTVRSGEPDHIAAAIDASRTVAGVSFVVESAEFPAELRVTLSDGAGGRFSAPVFQAPTAGWAEVNLPLSSFRATDAGRGETGSALRHGDAVRMIEIEDLTGLLAPDRGENTLYIDNFEIH
jgi:hypothetical protein